MTEFTISVSSEIMWKTSILLHDKLERNSDNSLILNITEEEYGIEYGCIVGPQQYDKYGKINQRDLTFPTESNVTLFLLRWT